MKLTYDPRYNIAYIRLHEKSGQVQTLHISDELNIDISPDGTVYGFELLNANTQLRSEDKGHLIVINQAKGDSQEIKLAS